MTIYYISPGKGQVTAFKPVGVFSGSPSFAVLWF